MKRFGTAFLLVAMSFIMLQAQDNSFYIGANGGMNLSKLKYTEDLQELYPTSNSVFGFNGGATFGFEIQNFTISTGLQYIQKGGEYDTDNFWDDESIAYLSAKEKLHYLSVPVQVGYRKYLTDQFGFSIALGPSFNFGLGGTLDETIEYFGTDDVEVENYKVAFGNGVNDDYRKIQLGFLIPPVIVFAVNYRAKVTFNVSWDLATGDSFNERYKDANTFFDDYKGNQLNHSTMFSVGYEYHFSFGDRY